MAKLKPEMGQLGVGYQPKTGPASLEPHSGGGVLRKTAVKGNLPNRLYAVRVG